MTKRRQSKGNGIRFSIQTKLIAVFLFTSCILLVVNMIMNQNMNKMISEIDKVYISNVNLNELQSILKQVQESMEEYLNTKTSDAMEAYYRNEDKYLKLMNGLNSDIVNDDSKIIEKNIKNMSLSYLEITDKTIEYKRGRNVEKYRVSYDEAAEMYQYINAYIYSLNNEQFKENTGNYQLLLSSLKYSEVLSMGILIVIAIANIILIILFTREMINPIVKLSEAANLVAKGHFDIPVVEVESRDEIEVVTKAFNQMVLSIQNYIEQIKKSMELEISMKEKELMMENHLKDARLRYLQAQINPHFLFNTLNAGAQLAMMEGADKTYRYIQNMADFFRYNVKNNKESVTLREEIDLVDSYIYILNVRFSGEIKFVKNIDERYLNVRLPSMLLQPIVENSIQYGIRDIDWEGVIELLVFREEDHVCISVRDNGIGMSQELIEKVMSSKLKEKDISEDSNGVGLDNVINRLRLFYSKQDVMEITSVGENMGTEVAIYIPITEGEK
ncbi:sensor histidine kinase [Konateibacter massiliensis]|uniref:sensor histidine kinase n=1 Tax=Konateibacter massiliensis TaxID=2002841 RepID=UPI000C15E847|nr:histidine kinase [Konateibacter massiliensis]